MVERLRDSNTDGVQYPENIASRITQYITVQDGNVCIALKGDDNLAYLAIGDLQGNIIREPYRPTGFSSYCATVYGEYIAYANDGVAYICNITDANSTAQPLADLGGSEIGDIKFLGNDLIAVEIDLRNSEDTWYIYNLNGDRIA